MALEIEVSKFSFQYWKDSPTVLRDISLTIPAGSICALLGPTNSGKTTVLQAIAGVLGGHHREAVASGTIRIGNESFNPFPKRVLFPAVGLTIQDPYYQISGLRDTVEEEVALTLEALAHPPSDIQSAVAEILSTLGLSHLSDRKPSTLSGGELQRVALANILVARPEILLLDEPSHSLDGVAQQRLISIIRSLRGIATVVIGDYQVELALQTADHFMVLNNGAVAFSGNRLEFADHLGELRTLLPVEILERILSTITPRSRRQNVIDSFGAI